MFLMAANIGLCAGDSKSLFREMDKSNLMFKQTCSNVSANFRNDHIFSGYIRNKCMLFETDKARALDVIFPLSNKAEKRYGQDYYTAKSNFVIAMNGKELNNIKDLVTEYCRYNDYKYAKKNPEACSPARIEGLFRY